jgi:hypothetical protein
MPATEPDATSPEPTSGEPRIPGDDPGSGVVAAIERVLVLASTWSVWDGRPIATEDGTRIYTPHKAIRRTADHLIDHLAEVEAVLAGQPTQPDAWGASDIMTAADLVSFGDDDLAEARERLTRLARTFRLRLLVAGPGEWDRPRAGWTLREIAEHLSSSWYAEQVGDLSPV